MSLDRMRGPEPEVWTTEAFLQHFLRVDDQMLERSFAFVLGAGASVSSGIPTGARLVDKWLGEIKLRDSEGKDLPVEEWATEDSLDIDDFEYQRRAEFYPQIYHRRFRDDLEEGYAYLEDVMKDAEPSLGYSMLVQILAETRHKVVITTNFDNLVADSVLIFTDTFAQICGHESLTGFIRVQPRRPLVAKIHRDLLLGPQNDPYETALLHEDWARELRKLFTRYTPLVLGYGGNDGSLMNFLESLGPGSIPGGIFWAYRGDLPNKRIRRLVARQAGKLVTIHDFDVFVTQLAEPLNLGLLDGKISRRADERATRLRDEWDKAKRSIGESAEEGFGDRGDEEAGRLAREALGKVETRRAEEGNDWWAWQLRANREPDPARREAIYREGVQRLPNSPELTGNFANFMWQARKESDEAEHLYRRAIELEPDSAHNVGNFARFMLEVRKEYDEAERLFRRAMELGPDDANNTSSFANFMFWARKEYDEAARLYRRAIELGPDDANYVGNFTGFLVSRGRIQEAKKMSDRAWVLAIQGASQVTAEVALYRGLLLRLDGKEDASALGRLKTLLKTGFDRSWWSFEEVLAGMDDALGEEDKKLYGAMAAAILDPEKVAALDEFPRWREVASISLDEPWPPFAG